MFQSTHPRRVWLCLLKKAHLPRRVSIHTPTQGVTSFHVPPQLDKHVSIHTPTQGVTFASWAKTAPNKVSIHTPTQGVTTGIWLSCHCYGRVSIHTPTQGVTATWWLTWAAASSFNPHTHAGCDLLVQPSSIKRWLFQSTHPRRVWHGKREKAVKPLVSIHTPTQGVTPLTFRHIALIKVSIHTPTQGVTFEW